MPQPLLTVLIHRDAEPGDPITYRLNPRWSWTDFEVKVTHVPATDLDPKTKTPHREDVMVTVYWKPTRPKA